MRAKGRRTAKAAEKPRQTAAQLTRQLGELTAQLRIRTVERDEALAEQAAAAEILQIINTSQGNLQPVFDAILEKAHRLCGAAFGSLNLADGEMFRAVATHGLSDAFADMLRRGFRHAESPAVQGVLAGESFVQIRDMAELDHPVGRAAFELSGIRTALFVPLRKDAALLGIIVAARQEVQEFSEKQVTLLQSFADQAVIAIENARLITETREALAHQTATAEVLGIINSSPGDLAPVFSAILDKAHSLCDAAMGSLFLYDGKRLRATATRGYPEEVARGMREGFPVHPNSGPSALIAGARLVHRADLAEDPDPAARAVAERGGVHANLLLPLRKDGAFLGMISCNRREIRLYTDKEIALLENFAAQAVIAMENARLLAELRESLERQTATAEVLGVINSSQGNLQPVFDAILQQAHSLCGVDYGSLHIYDGEWFRARAVHNLPEAFANRLRQGFRRADAPPMHQALLRGERLVQIADMAEIDHPITRSAVAVAGLRTGLFVPLRRDDAFLGVIVCARRDKRPFSDKEITLLESFAAQAVIAMENARLLGELRTSLERQTATAEILRVIASTPGDPGRALDTIAETAARMFDARSVLIRRLDGTVLRSIAAAGPMAAAQRSQLRELSLDAPTYTCRCVIENRQIHLEDLMEVQYGADAGPGMLARQLGVRTVVFTPLSREGQAIGVLTVYRGEVRPFHPDELELVKGFADQAVIAIENARLMNELRARTDDLQEALRYQTATSDVLKVISRSAFDLQPVLDTLIDTAARLCVADDAAMALRDGEVLRYVATVDVSSDFSKVLRERTIRPGRETVAGRVAIEGKVVHIADITADPDYHFPEAASVSKARTLLGVPMLREGVVIGTLSLARQRVEPFTERQIELVKTFADQAVIAVENARLITETREARDAAEAALRELKAAQANLIQAEKMASLGQLTAGIAHEIKNPLNFVNNFANLSNELLGELKDVAGPAIEALDEDKRAELDEVMGMLSGNLAKIAEHGKRADGIVKSMLAHSRGGSGDRQVVDLNALVEESLNLAFHGARAQDKEFNITLERALDPAMRPIELVPQDITRVFLNLFGNGFYAATRRARRGGDGAFRPVLRVATREAGDAVEISVRDNGIAIAAGIRDKLFQPFFTTKPTGEGTGLGLSISYDIVTQRHGGTITVESEEGAFTEFTIRLPRRGPAVEAKAMA